MYHGYYQDASLLLLVPVEDTIIADDKFSI